jgi:hypothetical protein
MPERLRTLLGGAWYHNGLEALQPATEGAWMKHGEPNDITGFRCARSCGTR